MAARAGWPATSTDARARIDAVLELADDELIDAVGGDRREHGARRAGRVRRRRAPASARRPRASSWSAAATPAYPAPAARARPPARGAARRRRARAAAGARVARTRWRSSARGAASPYGLDVAEVARARARGARESTVLSGMALGIDSAAHAGRARRRRRHRGGAARARPSRPYPPSGAALHRRIIAAGAAVSELPPGAGVRRWMFPARNRIIAALAAMTVVVEAGERSGALADRRVRGRAGAAGRSGAGPGHRAARPPGRMSCSPAARPSSGAPQDVLDALFGAGSPDRRWPHERPALDAGLARLLAAIARRPRHRGSARAGGLRADGGLAALAALELAGYVRRGPGGRYRGDP